MAAGLRAMLSAARTHPRATNAVVAGSCGACGDWMTQTGASPEAPFDVRRNLAFAAFGAFWSVPGRLFYIALARYVPGDTLQSAIKGALIGELALDLPITTPLFIATTDTLRGRDMGFIVEHFRRDYCDCAISGFCIWFPATVVNLRLVPLQYRVIFDSVTAVIWSALISVLSNRGSGQ